MGYINIPVYLNNQNGIPAWHLDDVINWFSEVHTGARIDFEFINDKMVIYNNIGSELWVEGYASDSVFELIEPKTEGYRRSDWYDMVRQKCKKKLDMIEKSVPSHKFTDQELYNIYINEKENHKLSKPMWYVGDIQINSESLDVDENDENRLLYTVSMEICAEEKYNKHEKYTKIKHKIEDQLVNLYSLEDDISIPCKGIDNSNWKKYVISKMIFSLKGFCNFEEVDALALRKEHIFKMKYPWIEEVMPQYPNQLLHNDIKNISYDFPVEETWADVMKAMGMFSSDDKDTVEKRIVKICMDNIKKTISFMWEDAAFQRDIVNSLRVFGSNEDEAAVLQKMIELLENMVVAHELGHMVFRSIRNTLELKENESLANWFSCLLADEFNRNIVALLVPYQSEEYQDFIRIPKKYKLKKKQYHDYCTKINSLLRSW